ncbi:MAG: quinone oxidoreductase [Polyangiaceae bacterium]|nr:quinone oxidoreductase [Polyangiaceae bacterium]
MFTVRAPQYGGPEVMVYEELPTPEPAKGQVRVKVAAVGVNFVDIYHRSGQYSTPMPVPIGLEGAGVVEAVGEGADAKVGDRVAWCAQPNSYSTHIVTTPDKLVPVPAGCDLKLAAAIMLQGMTAHALAHGVHALGPNDTCLIHAAAGGVGQLLVQFAAQAGARVIATVSTEEKAKKVRALGAHEVVLYTQTDFEAEVRRLTNNVGVNVAYDSVGKDTFAKSLNCIRRRGLCVLFGQASGAVPLFEVQTLAQKGSLFLTRMKLADYIATRAELLERSGAVFSAVANGSLKIEIGGEFALKDAAVAHHKLGGRETTGKLILLP